jgi:hypothetical protein
MKDLPMVVRRCLPRRYARASSGESSGSDCGWKNSTIWPGQRATPTGRITAWKSILNTWAITYGDRLNIN